MSELNRATLTTINSDSKVCKIVTSSNVSSSGGGTSTSSQKTIRLELNLFEPNRDSFPEFNYSKLIHAEKVIFFIIFFFFPKQN